MNNEVLQWLGLIAGIVAAIALIKIFMRAVTNQSSAKTYPHRAATELPRRLNNQ